MSLESQERRFGTIDRADDEKTIHEEVSSSDVSKPKKSLHEPESIDPYQEKSARPSDLSDACNVAESGSPQTIIDENPDGGLRAWLVVFGASFYIIRSPFVSDCFLLQSSLATFSTFGFVNAWGVSTKSP
jgi:hypothetical protein